MLTLVSLFKKSTRKFSRRKALSMRPRWRLISWTYKQLYNFSSGIAACLEEHDVKKGNRVIIISGNSPMWVGSFFGSLLKGAIVVPLNSQSNKEFIEKIVKKTNAKIILKSSDIKIGHKLEIPAIDIDQLYDLEKTRAKFKEEPVDSDDIAEIVYTSGTTGDPKGVMLTHRNIVSNLKSISSVFKPHKTDRIASVLPLFHMYEQTVCLFMSLKYGLQVMYSPSVSSRAITATLQEVKATKILVVPEMLEAIIRKIESKAHDVGKIRKLESMFKLAGKLPYMMRRLIFRKVHKNFGGHLRFIACGGAVLEEEIEAKWNAMGFEVYQGYGLTETSPVSTSNVPGAVRIGSVGRPIPKVKVTLEENNEIVISGPNVFAGYYKDKKRTSEVLNKEGCFSTGDIGHFDKRGYLYISGREKYMIVTPSGENVYPEDLEAELKQIDGVKDSAVVGVKENGRTIIHAVLLGEVKQPEAVIDQANENLASYQKIQDFSVWAEDDFPRSATRKVKKEEVLNWIQSKKETTKAKKAVESTPLIKLLAAISGKKSETISRGSNLHRVLHMDSLMRIELVSRIEETMDAVVEEQQITNKTTVKELEEFIKKGKRETRRIKVRKWILSWPSMLVREVLELFLIFPIYRLRMKIKVEGLENIKTVQRPVIIMPNHISYIDALIVLKALPGKIRRKVAIAAALDVLYKLYWWAAWLLEFVFNSYPFPRREEDNIRPGLDYTSKLLDRNFSIMIFPEGKISRTGRLEEIKSGAGLIAVEMRVPVVPVYIEGVRAIMDPCSIWPNKKGTVTVRFGKPISFLKEYSYTKATKKIESVLKKLAKG